MLFVQIQRHFAGSNLMPALGIYIERFMNRASGRDRYIAVLNYGTAIELLSPIRRLMAALIMVQRLL